MPGKKPWNKIIGVTLGLLMVVSIAPLSALADEPLHENPETAPLIFNNVSLLQYYSSSLEFVLSKNPAEVKARLEKMPFANIPDALVEPAGNITTSGTDISQMVMTIDKNIYDMGSLLKQSRLQEATDLAAQTFAKLSQAYLDLGIIEQSTNTTGLEMNVGSSSNTSSLKIAYIKLIETIDRIRKLLDFYNKLVLETSQEAASLAKNGQLLPTELTLDIIPTTAFVGDTISFDGNLLSNGKPLAGREIEILFNSSNLARAKTDSSGHYQGTLQVPYWYIPEIDVQALYYPQDKDQGVYLASLSQTVKLEVLYYEGTLDIKLQDKAYPGLKTPVSGKFEYGQSPPLQLRTIEIYLDDTREFEGEATQSFTKEISIKPDAETGWHNVTISTGPAGRYAPITASGPLNVVQAIPILDLNLPEWSLIPGGINISGSLRSDPGLLSNASVTISMGNSKVNVSSTSDGTFHTRLGVGMIPGLIGRQTISIGVLPGEPWNADFTTTRNLIIVNWISCSGFLFLFIILAIYLPRRLQRRLGIYWKKRERSARLPDQPDYRPVYTQSSGLTPSVENGERFDKTPRERIFDWYRSAVALIQSIARTLFSPQKTLREFAAETGKTLGPAANYFMELTLMVERLLYSRYKPTSEDAKKGQQLSMEVKEGVTGERY